MDELNRLVKVRALALSRFGENNIPPGAPMATLENVLVPVYLMHRYQAEAATKLVGGVNYAYAARGDGGPTNDPLPTVVQRAALAAVIQTLQPAFLALPERIIALIPPRPPGYERDRELFDAHTGLTFDPLAAAESWVDTELDLLFNPQRLSRIVEQNARGKSELTLPEVFDAALRAGQTDDHQSPLEKELASMVERHVLQHLFRLATTNDAEGQVSATAIWKIRALENALPVVPEADPQAIRRASLRYQIEEFFRAPRDYQPVKAAKIPDGSPIGCEEESLRRVLTTH